MRRWFVIAVVLALLALAAVFGDEIVAVVSHTPTPTATATPTITPTLTPTVTPSPSPSPSPSPPPLRYPLLLGTPLPPLSNIDAQSSVSLRYVATYLFGIDTTMDPIVGADVSRRGNLVAAWTFKHSVIYDPAAGTTLAVLDCVDIEFSPDGSTMACRDAATFTLALFSVPSLEQLATYALPIGNWDAYAFSPDGQSILAITQDRRLFLLSSATLASIRQFQSANLVSPIHVAFSPDGKWVFVQDTGIGRLHLWRVEDGRHWASANFGGTDACDFDPFVFLPDGSAIVGAHFEYLPSGRGKWTNLPTIWGVPDLAKLGTLPLAIDHDWDPCLLAYSPDGSILASVRDEYLSPDYHLLRQLRFLRSDSYALLRALDVPQEEEGSVLTCLRFSPDATFLVLCEGDIYNNSFIKLYGVPLPSDT
jgi:WD40 repeat protein